MESGRQCFPEAKKCPPLLLQHQQHLALPTQGPLRESRHPLLWLQHPWRHLLRPPWRHLPMLQDPIHAALKLAACTELAHEGSGGAVAVGAHLLGGAISISGAPSARSRGQPGSRTCPRGCGSRHRLPGCPSACTQQPQLPDGAAGLPAEQPQPHPADHSAQRQHPGQRSEPLHLLCAPGHSLPIYSWRPGHQPERGHLPAAIAAGGCPGVPPPAERLHTSSAGAGRQCDHNSRRPYGHTCHPHIQPIRAQCVHSQGAAEQVPSHHQRANTGLPGSRLHCQPGLGAQLCHPELHSSLQPS
eukprot:jgi/Astpho2/3818/Aster-04344